MPQNFTKLGYYLFLLLLPYMAVSFFGISIYNNVFFSSISFTFKSYQFKEFQEYIRIPDEFECSHFFEKNKSKFKEYSQRRIAITKEPNLSMKCTDIQKRVFRNRNFTRPKNTFAVARNVYQEYYLQEILLSMAYSPFNSYCFAVDAKSSPEFVVKLRKMGQCLENVIVLNETFQFDSAGHYQGHGQFACMEALLKKDQNWKYVLLVQSGDIFLKTVDEVSHIIDIFGEAPLFGFQNATHNKNRIPKVPSWTPKDLGIFKNESERTDSELFTPLSVIKSANQVGVSRSFVKGVFENLNTHVLLDLFNDNQTYGVDEMLLATLAHSLNLPGQVENACFTEDVFKFIHWDFADGQSCDSKKNRHGICLLGIEYLPKLRDTHNIIGNKIWPEFDFGTVVCVGEMLKNRSEDPTFQLKEDFYRNFPHVREMQQRKNGTFNSTTFKC